MYQKPTAPRTIGGVLDDTLQLYVAALPRTWLPSLLVSVITVAVSYFFVSSIPLSASPTSAAELMTRYQAMIRAFGVLYIPVFILSLVFYGMMTAIVAAVARGESPTFGDALKLGVRRAPALFVASLVFGISIAIGFILLLIPGCYVWNRLQLFMVPVVAESKGPFESLGVSWRLVGGNWWRTATVVFVMFVILIVLQMCLGALAAAFTAVSSGGAGGTPAAAALRLSLVSMLLGGVIRVFTMPLIFSAFVALYQDLLLRKGGGDLEARLGALPKA